MPLRRSAWKAFGLLVGFLVILVGAFLAWVEWSTSRAWEQLGDRCERLLKAECERPALRVLLRPGTLPGAPWDDYQSALAAAPPVTCPDDVLLEKFVNSDDANLRGEIRSLLNRHAKVLEDLSRGAVRQDLEVPDFRSRVEAGDTAYGPPKVLMRLAFCDARLAFERGDDRKGLRRLGDVLQFAQDRVWTGLQQEVGDYHIAMILVREQVGHLLAAGRPGVDARAGLERLLEAVDAAAPRGEFALRREAIDLSRRVHAGGIHFVDPGPRHLFSKRRQGLAWELFNREQAAEFEGLDDWPGSLFLGKWKEAGASPLLNGPIALRVARAHLRVARAALAWRHGGKVPELADPLGTSILFREEIDGVTIWSLGSDLRNDDGGPGDYFLRIRR